MTTIVGGNWKVLHQYTPDSGDGVLTIQAPKDWDHKGIVMLLSDQQGRVSTFSLTVETIWNMGDPFVDRRDERIYTISFVGDKWWRTQDLKYSKVDGYTYDEVISDLVTNDKVCPLGWRIPNDDDWLSLDGALNPDAFGSATVNGDWWSSTVPDGDNKVSVWTINASKWGTEKIPTEGFTRGVRCVKDGFSLENY